MTFDAERIASVFIGHYQKNIRSVVVQGFHLCSVEGDSGRETDSSKAA
jgi:hypothetical protein